MSLHLTAPELRTRLETLPQELYDEIFDLTFAPDSGQILVTQGYKFPVQLHVSSQTRKDFIKRYYGEARFLALECTDTRYTSGRYLRKWVDSLCEDSLKVLRSKDRYADWVREGGPRRPGTQRSGHRELRTLFIYLDAPGSYQGIYVDYVYAGRFCSPSRPLDAGFLHILYLPSVPYAAALNLVVGTSACSTEASLPNITAG